MSQRCNGWLLCHQKYVHLCTIHTTTEISVSCNERVNKMERCVFLRIEFVLRCSISGTDIPTSEQLCNHCSPIKQAFEESWHKNFQLDDMIHFVAVKTSVPITTVILIHCIYRQKIAIHFQLTFLLVIKSMCFDWNMNLTSSKTSFPCFLCGILSASFHWARQSPD